MNKILAFILLFVAHISFAQVVISDENQIYEIGKNTTYFQIPRQSHLDVNGILTFINPDTCHQEIFNKGVSRDVFWVFFDVQNFTDIKELYIESENVDLVEFNLYEYDPKNNFVIDSICYSRNSTFDDFKVDFSFFVFPVKVDTVKKHYVLKLKSDWPVQLPMHIGTRKAMDKSFNRYDIAFGIFAGVTLIYIIVTLFTFILTKERCYVYFLLYLLAFLILQTNVMGFGQRLLWSDFRAYNGLISIISTAFSGIFLIAFIRSFLETKKNAKFYDRVFVILIVVNFLNAIIGLYYVTSLYSYILNGGMILLSVLSIIVALKIWRNGFKPAKYFFFGCILFLTGMLIFALGNLGYINYSSKMYYLIPFGATIQYVFMGFALAERFQFINQRHDVLLRTRKAELEKMVDQRTNALNEQMTIVKEQNHEKEVMLKEIHHRVKNNLQVINSLLRLQSHTLSDETAKKVFLDAQQRVISMAMVHEKMYTSSNLSSINIDEYLKDLFDEIKVNYQNNPNLTFKFNVEKLVLGMKTSVPLGLIMNELITNSFKHAFPNQMEGELSVELFSEKDDLTLIIADNGVGFTEVENTDSIGMELVEALVEQLDGKIVKADTKKGTRYEIELKKQFESNKLDSASL